MRTPLRPMARRGLGLAECLVVLAMLSTLALAAAPSLTRLLDTRRLMGTAGELSGALHLARHTAVARQEAVSTSLLGVRGGGTCHVVHTGSAALCRCLGGGEAQCNAPSLLIAAGHHPNSARIVVRSTVPSVRFDPRAGTATPAGRFVVATADGRDIHAIVNLAGRVRRCTTSAPWGGESPCTTP